MRRAFLLGFVMLAGCQEYELENKVDSNATPLPAIEVDPLLLDFWLVSAGDTEILEFTVANVGEGNLFIDNTELTGTEAFTLVDNKISYILDPGDSRTVEVAFSPLSPEAVTGSVVILSDDPDRPEEVVELLGAGRTPLLQISPDDHNFGRTEIPCGDEVELTLQNVGNDDLVIDSFDYVQDGQFALRGTPTLPVTLVPGAYTNFWVDWLPQFAGTTEAALNVDSNDPRGLVSAIQRGRPFHIGGDSDTFTAPVDPPVDILFAVDQSCSMDDDAVSLAANFSTFITAIGAETSGWNLGVVTFDHGCFNNGILEANTSNVQTLFDEAVGLGEGINIQDTERLFKLVDRALQQTSPGACNEGFLRPNAVLHIIVVSDEPERSPSQASAWTWDYWVNRFETSVSSPSLLTISGVVDLNGCNDGADGYLQAIQATGGEALPIGQNPHVIGTPPDTEWVCDDVDWATHASTLAQASLTFLNNFPLSKDADVNSIQVEINGVPLTTGWTYDPVANAVVLDDAVPGSTVDVSYDLAAVCP